MCSGTPVRHLHLAARSMATAEPRWANHFSFIFISSSGHFLQEEWWKGSYRDCNGESNGTPLPQVIPDGVGFEFYFVEVLFHIGRTDLKTTIHKKLNLEVGV